MKSLARYLNYVFTAILLVLAAPAWAQQNDTHRQSIDSLGGGVSESYIGRVDSLPMFPGGKEAMRAFLRTNLESSWRAKKDTAEGKVIVRAVITPEGRLTDIVVEKGIGEDLDNAVLEAVRRMPAWRPAYRKGKPIKCTVHIPVHFPMRH